MKALPKLLNSYKDADYPTKLKALFFYYLMFIVSVLIIIIIFYTGVIQMKTPEYKGVFYYPILISEIIVLAIVFLSFIIFIKGYFGFSSHFFLISTIFIIWYIILHDKGNALIKYDTLLYMPAVFSLFPIILKNDKPFIFIYLIFNLFVCALFLFVFETDSLINVETKSDLFYDFCFSSIFLSIVSFSISRINQNIHNHIEKQYNEKLKIELAYNKSESKYKDLTELLPQTVWEIDNDGYFTYTNRKGVELFGYNQEEIKKGITIYNIIEKEQHSMIKAGIQKIKEGGKSDGNEYMAITKDKRKFPVQIFTNCIYENGQISGMRGITIDISERKLAEKALIESESKYKALMESINEVIIVADNDHVVEYVNEQFTKKLGYSKEEIIGKKGFQFLHDPEDLKIVEEANQNRINKKNTIYELKFKAKNGEKFDFLVSGSPYLDHNGNTIGSIGYMMDISDRKETEKQLIASELKYRTLFENAQIGIYQTTPSGNILNVNPSILRMLGYENLEQLKEKNLTTGEFHVGSERQAFLKEIEKTGVVKNFESQWKDINGETIYIIENAKAVKDNTGKTIYYDGFVENITDRKKAEIELKYSELRYRSIIESFPDILIISDRKGRILYMNDAAQKISGITPKDYKTPVTKLKIHPKDRFMIAKATKEVLTGEKKYSDLIESRFFDIKGKLHWFSGIISKFEINGEIMIQTLSRDITEKKENEIELDKYRNKLEILVKERTEELYSINEELRMSNEELSTQREVLENTLNHLKETQDRLIISEKMASLGVLTAGIAHEINNPLNFISGGILGIESWIEEHFPERKSDVNNFISGMNEGIRRVSSIISGLNKYSRYDEESFTLCDIGTILDSCLMMLNYQIKGRIHVKKEYVKNDFFIFGNEGRLHQAFLNIISNSVQAIEKEGLISIIVQKNEHNLEILFVDNGIGIKSEHINKIMDPFFTTKEPGEGTGLGLSITFNIIEQHNGTIDVKSEVGIGTQISIKLPIKTQK